MNMHNSQSLQTVVELKYLAAVSKMIISPSENKPIIQPAQDNLLGLFKLTDDNVFLSQQEFMNMLVGIEKFNGVIPEPAVSKDKVLKWTGKQLYSIILPPITYYQKTSEKNPLIKDLVIEEGILKQGQVEKGASNSILHQIYNDYGHKEATRYLNDLQRLVTRYMVRSGFSVGISDLIVPKEVRKHNEEVILQGKKDIIELTKKVHLNILDSSISSNDRLNILYDTMIGGITKKIEEAIRKSIMQKMDMSNRIKYIISSGSKGLDINIQQMMCLVGPQSIDGKPDIPKGFTDRTLPHYPRYESSGEARGFITSNFLNGLNPQEFFFHAMAGREGVIDTAVKTANSGYLQRKLVKCMEDLKVAHDFSVRASNNDIVQFCYGYDGFNSVDLEIQKKFDFIKISLEKLQDKYYLDPTDKYDYVLASEIAKMKKIDGWRDKMLEYNKNLESLITEFHDIYSKFNIKIDNASIYYPVNFNRLILNTVKQFKLADVAKADIHPLEIITEIQSLIEYTRIHGQRNVGCEVLIWNYLAPKILLRDKKFNRIAFMHVVNAIKMRWKYSLAEGGEMVGPLAAQSLGEKTTQMTLHSVDWETEILIAKNGDIITPKIGEFIDSYYNECLADPERKKKIQYINDGKQIYIPLDDGNDWRAYSCDEDGKVMWTKLEAITRHPVVNEDGSETILEVELECGRIVKATKGKSFLVYNEAQNKIIGINGSDLQVGDLLPICEGLEMDNSFNEYTYLDLKEYLSPREYMFEDEMQKALNIMKTSTDKNWFKNNQGITFNIPYNTDKSFKGTNSFDKIKSGCVYPKSLRSCHTHIPAMIELNEEFGYFVGAYLADGMSNEYRIIISKQEISFIEPIKQLMAKWDIGYRFVESIKKDITEIKKDDNGNEYTIKKQWKSYDHIFQSTLLAELIGKVFGKTCEDKVIPLWVLQAPTPFLQGLISGYFSGDGHVSQEGVISVSSVGYKMTQTIGLILNRFNISWTLHKKKQNLIKFPNAKEYIYNLYVNKYYNNLFNEKFKLTINSKKERLNNYFTNKFNNNNKLQNTIFKKILSINEILPTEKIYEGITKRFVYDLTVATTKHFCTSDLLVQFDTFHLAGVGEKSAVTQGVPRLTELLSNTKNPKNSEAVIYLDPAHRFNRELSEKVKNNIELKTVRDVLESSAIYLEPNNDYANVLPEDREFMEIYRVFSELDPQATTVPENPWVIRLEFDRRKIIDNKITMEDINQVLKLAFPQSGMMFMDDNAAKLVFRMRMSFQSTAGQVDDDLQYLKDKIEEIGNVVIKGVDGISKVYMQEEEAKMRQIVIKENGSFIGKAEYTLETEGTNLFEILCRKGVDTTRCYSNDPNEMYAIFGIEAARYQIQSQLTTLFVDTGVEMSPRHFDLLCDKMCQHGEIMSVSRHGIKKENIGPLAKASFEETTDQLLDAALFGAYDNIKGVSSNIMVGQIPTCGTGDSTLLLDEELLNTQEDIPPTEEDTDIAKYFQSSEYCNAGEVKFSLADVRTSTGEFDNYVDVMVE